MLNILESVSADAIASVIGVLLLAGWLVGFASGRSHARTVTDDTAGQVRVTEACLAILGLLLAFCFASAYSKYEARRQTVVQEANAIGTFWVRVGLLPEAVRPALHEDLKEYVRLHLEVVGTGFDTATQRDLGNQMLALQTKITDTVLKTLEQPDVRPLTMPIMTSLNDVLDQFEIRIATRMDHVPASVVFLLLGVSALSALMLGRSQGVTLRRPQWVSLIFLLLVVFIIYITLDLDQPWHGLSRTSQLPMERLARSMGLAVP